MDQRPAGPTRGVDPTRRGRYPNGPSPVGRAFARGSFLARPPYRPPVQPSRVRKTRPTLLCWLRATAPDGLRFELTRTPELGGAPAALRGAFGPEQATGLAGQLERRGWRDVQIVRRRLDRPEAWATGLAVDRANEGERSSDAATDEELARRIVRVGRERLIAIELPPPPAVAAARRGLRLATRGDWAGAREALRAATERHQAAPEVWRALGVAQGRCGDWRHARRALERALELGDGEAGRLLEEIHQIELLQRATQRRAWDATAHRQLGLLLMAWERGDEALEHLERAVQLAPKDAAARLALGLELLCRSRWADALAVYTAALELDPDGEQRAAAEEGLALARAGRLPDPPAEASRDVWQDLLAAG